MSISRMAYFDGEWIPEEELKISAWDLAVMQSASCFEMCRSFHHRHFKLREHLDRLRESCRLLSIPLPSDFDRLEEICAEVTEANPLPHAQEHRLLIVVNAGAAPMYREIAGTIPHSYCYVATFPLRYTVQGFSKYFTEGVHCVTSPIQQVPDACVPSQAKHRSRLHFHLAQQQAPAGTWPILRAQTSFYNEIESEIAEAPGANLVVVKRGSVRVLSEHALPGISMQTVQELTGARSGSAFDLDAHDEVFLTGTPFCMIPVVSIDGKPIGDGQIGPVYKATLQKWNQLVGLDIAEQICAWDAQKLTTV